MFFVDDVKWLILEQLFLFYTPLSLQNNRQDQQKRLDRGFSTWNLTPSSGRFGISEWCVLVA